MGTGSYGKRLGELVRKKRRIKGLSQLQLSEDAFGTHTKVRRISDLETGVVANPHPKTVDPIIVQLGISEEELAACLEESTDRDPDLDRAYREARSLIDALAYQFDYANPDAGLGELDAFLRSKAKEWRHLRARLDGIDAEDSQIAAQKVRAAEALASGKLDEVDDILAALEERFQQQQTLAAVSKQAEIRITRADACLMKEDPDGALAHYLRAARFFEPFSEAEAVRVLEENAHRIYEGSLRTLKPRFDVGTELLKEALRYGIVADDSFRRGQISYQLSLLYRNAGQHAAGEEREELTELALTNARSAEIYAAEAGKPYQVVVTKVSLANCLLDKGRDITAPDVLEEAIAVLRSAKVIALEEPIATPMLSHVCNSLGSVLLAAARDENDAPSPQVIEEALTQFSEAIESAEEHCNYETWGAAKANRARMLAVQAERYDADDPQQVFLFIRAISEYLAAIETYPETFFPSRFAEMHISLAGVLSQLAEVIQDARAEPYMLRAISSLEVASLTYEEHAPGPWAKCQMQIGSIIARHGLSKLSHDPRYDFNEAIIRFESARRAFAACGDHEHVKICDHAIDRSKKEIAQLAES